jgi:TorA maturation chaperone TorD
MGGTAAGELTDLYRRAGLQASEAPPDYLGTLLECAAWLAEQEDGAALLRELEDEHLTRWVPRFARNLQASSGLALYRNLGARLAELFPEDTGNA